MMTNRAEKFLFWHCHQNDFAAGPLMKHSKSTKLGGIRNTETLETTSHLTQVSISLPNALQIKKNNNHNNNNLKKKSGKCLCNTLIAFPFQHFFTVFIENVYRVCRRRPTFALAWLLIEELHDNVFFCSNSTDTLLHLWHLRRHFELKKMSNWSQPQETLCDSVSSQWPLWQETAAGVMNGWWTRAFSLLQVAKWSQFV